MKYVPHLTLVTLLSTSVAIAGGTHDNPKFAVGEPATGIPDRIVQVSMHDTMRFKFGPGLESLRDGEVVKFVLSNKGSIVHEFSIGNADEQKKHAAMMSQMTTMKHKDANATFLDPGKTTSLTWRFKGKDTVVFACNIPGHFEAGMRNDVALNDSNSSS